MQEEKSKKILITAALPYINNVPHLGHIVGSHLPADIFARYCRLKGKSVVFLGGSDENGTPSELAAKKVGVKKEVFCEKLYQEHKKVYDWFNISYDVFSRTSQPIHHKTVKKFFKKVYNNGYIIEKKLRMPFCKKCDRTLADRYIKGACPKCDYKEAHGNQCEKCGSLLNPDELINPKCTICGSSPEFREFPHLFFRLDKFSKKLKEWIKTKESSWSPYVIGITKGWLKEGLKPRCITRDLKHGVKVPLEKYENKVIFVWFEALIGYISFLKEYLPNKWKEYWQGKNSKIFHFLGKDNIPFHSVFFPAMLMAHENYNLPARVVGLQYLNYEGKKFSKSKGVGVFCEKLPEINLDPDYWRFYLSFLIPEKNDTNFSWDDFQEKINGELIGNFSNFIHRSLSFIESKLKGEVSRPSNFSKFDKDFIKKIKTKINRINRLLSSIKLRKALKEILALAREGNKYFDKTAPWKSIKHNKKKANKSLYICAELSCVLATLISPYLPDTSKKIFEQLGIKEKDKNNINKLSSNLLSRSSYKVGKLELLFQKIDEKKINNFKDIITGPRDINSFFNT